MEYAPPQAIPLAEFMADKNPLWEQMKQKYGLQAYTLQELAVWSLGDFIFQCDWDVLLSATKVQQAGFHTVVDSEEMFMLLFQTFRDGRIVP